MAAALNTGGIGDLPIPSTTNSEAGGREQESSFLDECRANNSPDLYEVLAFTPRIRRSESKAHGGH